MFDTNILRTKENKFKIKDIVHFTERVRYVYQSDLSWYVSFCTALLNFFINWNCLLLINVLMHAFWCFMYVSLFVIWIAINFQYMHSTLYHILYHFAHTDDFDILVVNLSSCLQIHFFHYWVDKRFYPWNMYMYTFSPKFVTCIHVWLKHLCAWKHIKDHLCVWFLWMCMDSLHMYTKLILKVICVSDSISVYLNIVRWTSK